MSYYVYIMASRSKTLYIDVTNDLERRVLEHESGASTFTERYNISRLVYYEESADSLSAIEREKQLKGWLRNKKLALIDSANPEWEDFSENWFTDGGDPSLRSG